MTVPTVDEVLARHRASNGLCHWDAEGGRIELPEADLRQALEAAWPAMVEIDA